MKIKAKIEFFDREIEDLRKVGAVFEAQPDRAKKLIKMGYAEEVETESKSGKKAQ